MKIKTPKGMTEEQVIDCINEVCKNLAHKYKFGYFDTDDIKQEAFVIAIDGLYGYDGSIPLRNFLYIHVANRLKNLKRDYHFRQPTLCKKCKKTGRLCDKCIKKQDVAKIRQNIMSPIDVDSVRSDNESSMQYSTSYEDMLDNSIIIDILEKNIPKDLWGDYLKFKDSAYIPTTRKQKLLDKIYEILDDHGYKKEW